MYQWIYDFSTTYNVNANRWPVIYTTEGWWKNCTGNSGGVSSTSPLWISRHSNNTGTLPGGWKSYTFWQWASTGPDPGGQDFYNGDMESLKK